MQFFELIIYQKYQKIFRPYPEKFPPDLKKKIPRTKWLPPTTEVIQMKN